MKLENCVDILSGYAFKSKLFNTEGKGIPIIRIRDVTSNSVSTYYDGSYNEEYLISNGDLLIGMDGKFNLIEWQGGKAILNQRVCKITPKENIADKGFVKFLVPKSLKEIEDKTSFVTVKHLSVKKIKEIELPELPLKTQQRIAAILDDAAALRDKTAQLLTEYDLLAQSIFLEMFGDPVLNQEEWNKDKLIQVSKQITDGTHHSPKPTKTGYPYVTAKHIKEMSLEFDAKPTFVDKTAHEEIYARCQPEFNDVLLIKDGATTGVACLNSFKEPISLLSSVGLIKPNKQLVNPTFLVFWFNHSGVKQQLIRKFMSGAAIKRYTISKMKKFDLIVPPIELQNQFAEKIALIEQQKALAKQELQESEDLFNCLLQKAFKGAL
ncbi:restriction endonuclease subunit S [Patiriisocius marinus]|uniref:restriction endonuclease subunit S n=1 Tax=Patiriisocius marinus TaxID=1397112 RepID=UPI00232D2743|nr:restriction endonuclease subunit S [Patiriisocius marinus]